MLSKIESHSWMWNEGGNLHRTEIMWFFSFEFIFQIRGARS